MTFWDRPDAQAALAARSMDRRSVHQASAFEEVALDWCDHGRHYVAAGTTRPYTPDHTTAGARACLGCLEAMRAEVLARETYCGDCGYLESLHRPDGDTPNGDSRCPAEWEARAAGGDR